VNTRGGHGSYGPKSLRKKNATYIKIVYYKRLFLVGDISHILGGQPPNPYPSMMTSPNKCPGSAPDINNYFLGSYKYVSDLKY